MIRWVRMPWTVLPADVERANKNLHDSYTRASRSCHDTIEAVVVQTSALLRRRQSEDLSTIAALLANGAHCVPCLSLLTHLDARRVYAALERLKAQANVRLVSGICTHCKRSTTVHEIAD